VKRIHDNHPLESKNKKDDNSRHNNDAGASDVLLQNVYDNNENFHSKSDKYNDDNNITESPTHGDGNIDIYEKEEHISAGIEILPSKGEESRSIPSPMTQTPSSSSALPLA
jgi:hypothetical protein